MRELSQEFFLSDKYLNLDKFYLNNLCVSCEEFITLPSNTQYHR